MLGLAIGYEWAVDWAVVIVAVAGLVLFDALTAVPVVRP